LKRLISVVAQRHDVNTDLDARRHRSIVDAAIPAEQLATVAYLAAPNSALRIRSRRLRQPAGPSSPNGHRYIS